MATTMAARAVQSQWRCLVRLSQHGGAATPRIALPRRAVTAGPGSRWPSRPDVGGRRIDSHFTTRQFATSVPACKKKSGGSSNGGSSRAKATQDGEPDLGLATLEKAIEDAIARMKEDVAKLRTGGRFDPQLIEQLKVSLNKKKDTARIGDLAHVVPKGGRTIAVLLADEAHVKSVSSAISSSNFSLTPQTDPANPLQLNIPIPPPTRESRDAAVKAAKAFMEKATQAIKNARQDVNKRLKEMGQRKTITPDTLHAALKDMEKATQAGQKRVKEAWEAAHRSLQQ